MEKLKLDKLPETELKLRLMELVQKYNINQEVKVKLPDEDNAQPMANLNSAPSTHIPSTPPTPANTETQERTASTPEEELEKQRKLWQVRARPILHDIYSLS